MKTLVNIFVMKKITLKEAIALFGTKTELAKAMGVSLAAVSKLKEPLSDRVEPRVAMAVIRRFGDLPTLSAGKEKS